MVIIIGLLALFAGMRNMILSYPSVEVFSQQETKESGDGGQLVSGLLHTVLDKAFPAIRSETVQREEGSILQVLVRMVTRLNYKDPRTFIAAQLPIMGSYGLPVSSRGNSDNINRGDPYDPEEDLSEILRQYNPGDIDIDDAINEEAGLPEQVFQSPGKTSLNMEMPVVLIYHTHTSEAYRPSKAYNYTPTDVDRTIDPRYSVVRVGKELQQILQSQYGIKSLHITTFHDYPDYSPSYSRSLKSISDTLAKYPSIKIILDLHRDAFPMRNRAEEQNARALSAMNMGGTETARLTLVWGPGSPNSSETRKFAELLKNKINQQNPGLCRRVLEKETGQYNQQLSNYSALIEVGSNANTMEEALNSVPYLAKAISDAIKEIQE